MCEGSGSSRADVNLQDHKGYTALMKAARGGHEKCVDFLAEAESIPKDLRLQHLCRDAIRKHLRQMRNSWSWFQN